MGEWMALRQDESQVTVTDRRSREQAISKNS